MFRGNSPNQLGDIKEGIKLRALFSKGQCGSCVWYMGKGDRGRRRRRFIIHFWGMEKTYLECGKE
jgi:hypothetical protein